MRPPLPSSSSSSFLHPPPLPRPAPPAFCIFYSQGNKVMPKGGSFEGAAAPQSTAFFFLILHQSVCVCVCVCVCVSSEKRLDGLLLSPPAECVRSEMSLSQSNVLSIAGNLIEFAQFFWRNVIIQSYCPPKKKKNTQKKPKKRKLWMTLIEMLTCERFNNYFCICHFWRCPKKKTLNCL